MKPELGTKPPPLRTTEPWSALRQWTEARIGMGRAGSSLPTGALLDFALDHAEARDAVHAALDTAALATQLLAAGFSTVHVRSRASHRSEYLRRPDLGRRLAPECVPLLADDAPPATGRLTVVIADGLSARAPADHALPLLFALRDALPEWQIDTVVLATEARVALADEIGALRGAELVLMLLGERPGLKSPDSLGAYLTYRPRVGRTDAERNCVSNIRPQGLAYPLAAHKLAHLIRGAHALGATGVALKDGSDTAPHLPPSGVASATPQSSAHPQAASVPHLEPGTTPAGA